MEQEVRNATVFMLNVLTERAQIQLNGKEAVEFSKHWEVLKKELTPKAEDEQPKED